MKLRSLALSALLTLVLAPSWGQETEPAQPEITAAPEQEPSPEAPAAPVAEAPSTAEAETPSAPLPAEPPMVAVIKEDPPAPPLARADLGEGRLSVDFPEEDVRNILRNVADLFELNLIIPETLEGKASIKLRDVTWRQIFQEVLTPLGYTYRERENIISIVSLAQMKIEQETIIIPVTSGSLAEAKLAADSIVTQPQVSADGKTTIPGGRVIALAGASSLQITDTPEKINEVRAALAVLSKANSVTNTRQVLIETKFYDVTDTNARELGVRLDRIAGYREGTLRIFNNDEVPITGTPFTTAIYSRNDFTAAVAALERDDRIKLVTNPLIVTQQNRQAEIFERTTLRYFVPVPQSPNQPPSPPEIKEIEVKTGLTVTPSIIDTRDAQGRVVESLIQMQVTPEVSSLGQSDVYSASGVSISIPRVNSRSTTTHVVLKNGYTLALGGLVKTEQKKNRTKTPLLGDIPGLGALFRRTDDLVEQRTLLTFITARIVTPDGSQPEGVAEGTPADFSAPARRVITNQLIDALGVTNQDMPGYIEENVSLPDRPPEEPKPKK